jgi:replicative DNA helicase
MSEVEKSLGYLGYSFQLKVLSQILTDKNFAENIIPILEPSYFDDSSCRFITKLINDYHTRYKSTPTFDTLDNIVRIEVKTEVQQKYILDVVAEIKEQDLSDTEWTQEKSFKFCKQQELKKALKKAETILEKGDFEQYDEIEGYIKTALSYGMDKDLAVNVFTNLADVMTEDYRETIPTGIEGLDTLMKGGLAKGEIGVILAPMGIGKSSLLSKFSNSAFNAGFNVLQIFFEDNVREIQRKHICCWTGIPLTEMTSELSKDATVKKKLGDLELSENKLLLQRWSSDSMTMTQIKNYIRKLISDGLKIDIVLIDYIDCVLPEHDTENVHVDEGKIMRKFESMCHELNIAGWTATQGNRCLGLDTLVDIEGRGSIQIKDVKINEKILTHDGYRKITTIFPIQKQPVYKIKTKSGKEIICSSRHEFPVKHDILRSIQSGLKVGDKLLIKK